ncbi:N-acetylneuraminate synthase family protein [Candidatus Nitrosotenuis sp. DW1]|uniref:N-acetylneuraminate synthase family protein n=1 Tax=Candidatus Nitrosotenuis sp. DW1 TaxID=2259672 RepID=UPI0015CB31B2|nr:N-acetylneuraminate synthase family protein [Candidatus Nitrosotenuis sp. DW1]QLH09691.1 N-acylneuraminate-9-phosphate synthase [Candidatus Nitrosotenuis sp. DW1]
MLDSSQVFVIAEAGSNWKAGSYNEDIRRAKKLISVASECGADAVKFQTFRTNTVYVQNAGNSDYLEKSGIKKSINKIFENAEMPYEMLQELSEYCERKNIQFMSTPFSVADAKAINDYVKIHKVASYEINHVRLLEYLAKTKKPIILSTGASTYDEIDFAINLLKKHHVKQYALLQCTAKYPTPLESLNLLTIPEMRQKYDIHIGLSDHSLDPIVGPITAVGLGARIIEKHFTLDKSLPGPDHKFALTPAELKKMIEAIRSAEKTLGDSKKQILKIEVELRDFAVRRIQAIKDIKKGEKFIEGQNIDVLRPGNRTKGADARFLTKISGKKAIRSIKIGEGVKMKDCLYR